MMKAPRNELDELLATIAKTLGIRFTVKKASSEPPLNENQYRAPMNEDSDWQN